MGYTQQQWHGFYPLAVFNIAVQIQKAVRWPFEFDDFPIKIKSMAISGTDWLEVPTIYKAYIY